ALREGHEDAVIATLKGSRYRLIYGVIARSRPPKRAKQAPVLALGLQQPRKERRHRKPIDITGMYARQKRLREVRDGFSTEAAADELCNGFITAVAAGDEELGGHPHLRPPGKQRRSHERTEPRRNAEHRTHGQRMKPVVPLNVCHPRWKRRRQAAAEPELLAEGDRVALLRQQGVRAGVDRETVDLFAQDDAARPFGAFDDREGDATRLQL